MKARTVDRLEAPFQKGNPLPRVYIPDLDARVRTASGQKFPGRVPRENWLGAVTLRQIRQVRPIARIINRNDIRRDVPHRDSAAVRIEIQPEDSIRYLPARLSSPVFKSKQMIPFSRPTATCRPSGLNASVEHPSTGVLRTGSPLSHRQTLNLPRWSSLAIKRPSGLKVM